MADLQIDLTNEVEEALVTGNLNYEKLNNLVKKCQRAHVRAESVEDAIYDQLCFQLQEAKNSLESKGMVVSDCALDRLWENSIEEDEEGGQGVTADPTDLLGDPFIPEGRDLEEEFEFLNAENDGFYRDLKPEEYENEQVQSSVEYYMEYYGLPMFSIGTVKDWSDKKISSFAALDTLVHFSMKLNGHAVRVFYDDGVLVHAATRGRVTNAKNITKQLRNILGPVKEELRGKGVVEVRGEAVLKEQNLDKAREYNPGLKSPFSAVSSMISGSASAEQNQLLDLVAYRVLMTDEHFETKAEEYAYLSEHGFEVPPMVIENVSSVEDMQRVLGQFEEFAEGYDYMCDGVVAEVNSKELFGALGNDGTRNAGNIALKVGAWAQDMYTARVQGVTWNSTRDRITPVLLVSDPHDPEQGVLTAQGNRVRNVPVYNLNSMFRLGVKKQGLVHFRYGGEAGVVPCDSKGRTLEQMVQEYLS